MVRRHLPLSRLYRLAQVDRQRATGMKWTTRRRRKRRGHLAQHHDQAAPFLVAVVHVGGCAGARNRSSSGPDRLRRCPARECPPVAAGSPWARSVPRHSARLLSFTVPAPRTGPSTDRTVTDLPDPLSPTMPSISPGATDKLTPLRSVYRDPGEASLVRGLVEWAHSRDSPLALTVMA